jgi:hypothetical protein
MPWHIVTHTVSGAASLLFIVGPFTGRTRRAPAFVRIELFAAGIATLAWSIMGIYLYLHEADSSHTLLAWPLYWRLMLFRWTLGGIIIGVLGSLFTNRQYYEWKRASRINT